MKLGIAGNGVIVQEVLTFIDEIGFDEIYICGRKQSEEKLNALAREYHLTKVFTDYDELLASDAEVIYVGVLNNMHVDYSKRAIEAGKHVICEKPVVIHLSELKELEQMAKDKGVMLFEAMSIYHMPAYKQLQKDVKLLGDLKLCNFNYSQMSRRYKSFHEGTATPAVFDPKHNGGALRDLNVYNLSAMVGLFGTPKTAIYSANDCNAPGPSTIQGVDGTICIYPNVNGMTEYDVLFNDADTDTKEVDMSDGSHRLYFEFVEYKRIIEENDFEAQKKLLEYSKMVAEIIDMVQN